MQFALRVNQVILYYEILEVFSYKKIGDKLFDFFVDVEPPKHYASSQHCAL